MTLSDYTSIIHSASFTFLVGPEHTKLTIQSGLARHVSKPLDELMNNGETRESRHRIAALENEDVETFVGFCEYAYTGDYSVPSTRRSGGGDQDNCNASEKGLFRTESVFTSIPPPVTYSPAPPEDDYGAPGLPTPVSEAETVLAADEPIGDENIFEDGKKGKKGGKKGKKGKKQLADEEPSVEESAPINLTPPTTPPPEKGYSFEDPIITAPQSPMFPPQHDGSGMNTPRPSVPQRGNLWEEFTSLQYDNTHPSTEDENISFPFSPNRMPANRAPTSEPQPEPYVLFHAKLYIFAANYMIPSLARLCLKKLHQDLIIFGTRSAAANDNPAAASDIKTANMRVILQLLHFTYSNTSRYDPFFDMVPQRDGVIPPPKEDDLRKLVSHYAACKVRDLATITSSASHYYPPPMSVHSGVGGEGGYQPHVGGLGFRELLDGTRELASDLVYRMM
ncbi:hypothetical protein FQN54_003328 [Arachnomyces sp. PD_36]|nr:hypothetical protein FQN54_003328 [Arachnomyces sp. PD_36]